MIEQRDVMDASEHAAARERPRSRVVWTVLAALVALISVPVAVSRIVGQPDGTVYRFEIPPGTAARIAGGERVEVLPQDLEFKLRDRLVVRNRDSVAHQIGPFRVAPNQLLDKRFSETASMSSFCSLHADGKLTIEVTKNGGARP